MPPQIAVASMNFFERAGLNSVFGSTSATSTTAESTTALMSSAEPRIDSGSSLASNSTAVEMRSCNSGCRTSMMRAMWVRVNLRESGRTRNHHAATSVAARPARLRTQRAVVEKSVTAASIAMIARRQVRATARVAKSPRIKRSRRTRRIIAWSLSRMGFGS